MANPFQRSSERLVKRQSGGHALTLRAYQGTALSGDPIIVPYAVGTYTKDEREGIAVGTQKLMIAALSLPAGVDLTQQRYILTDATGVAAAFKSAKLSVFEVSVGGGEPALYTAPLMRGG